MEVDLDSSPPLDRLFSVLADARRRHVLTELSDRRGPTGVDELARSIARTERDDPTAEPPPESVRTIATALHHVHLPTLSAVGLLERDVDAGTVSGRPIPGGFDSVVATVTGGGGEVEPE